MKEKNIGSGVVELGSAAIKNLQNKCGKNKSCEEVSLREAPQRRRSVRLVKRV